MLPYVITAVVSILVAAVVVSAAAVVVSSAGLFSAAVVVAAVVVPAVVVAGVWLQPATERIIADAKSAVIILFFIVFSSKSIAVYKNLLNYKLHRACIFYKPRNFICNYITNLWNLQALF